LIEGGYLSNPREARRIADPAFREQLAETVAQALNEKSDAGSRKLEIVTHESQTSPPNQISELRANKIPPP